jgi:hypothetical protein
MSLFCIYRGNGPTDAYLVHHWLDRNGIFAQVRGEHRMGLRGDIPIPDAWPSIWVRNEDRDAAEAAIRTFNAPRAVHPRWICPACQEDNEPNFDSCWSCDGDRPGVFKG